MQNIYELRKQPHVLAILFETDEDTGQRTIVDIILEPGNGPKTIRRLRRRVTQNHGLIDPNHFSCYDQIIYDVVVGEEQVDVERIIKTQDVTARYTVK